jgi:secondary thiamine-phosphate synthase enzyme
MKTNFVLILIALFSTSLVVPSLSMSIHNNSNQQKQSNTVWYQRSVSITAPKRGCHLITPTILLAIQPDLQTIQIGLCNIFIQHTSASLTINENADPDVRRDMEVALNKIVPSTWSNDGTFNHVDEGDDDMPSHVKSSLMGASLTIPINCGRLALGAWQGIYLNEHRDQYLNQGYPRTILITLHGQTKQNSDY